VDVWQPANINQPQPLKLQLEENFANRLTSALWGYLTSVTSSASSGLKSCERK